MENSDKDVKTEVSHVAQEPEEIQRVMVQHLNDAAVYEKALRDGVAEDNLEKPRPLSEVLREKFGVEFSQLFHQQSESQAEKEVETLFLPKLTNDIMQNAMAAFTNLQLAHEICIDNNFRLTSHKKNESIENRIQILLKRAYWEKLDEDLAQVPPVYTHAFSVFEHIRAQLIGLLLPHHSAIKVKVEEMLDLSSIEKEIEREVLDFDRYVSFILDCLALLCSPSRDQAVAAIREMENPSLVFKSIIDVMEDMQLDMANYIIQIYRPKIVENCVAYERKKFGEILKIQNDLCQDGLHNTRAWLMRHRVEVENDPRPTIAKAFGEILTWENTRAWPETMTFDEGRLLDLNRECKRITIFGAMSLSVVEICRSLFKKSCHSLLNSIKADLEAGFEIMLPSEDMEDERKVFAGVDACSEEAVKLVAKYLRNHEKCNLDDSQEDLIRQTLTVIPRKSKVTDLLALRMCQHVEEMVKSKMGLKAPMNVGLSAIEVPARKLLFEFYRIVSHNLLVFEDVYEDIILGECPLPEHDASAPCKKVPEYLNKLQKLPSTTPTKNPPREESAPSSQK